MRLLNEHRVEYLLIGGYAVGFHGYPRATGDMDVWVHRTEANVLSLEDLKRNKKAAGRHKDLADLEQLPYGRRGPGRPLDYELRGSR